ncbi:unnamed protein product [Protopolystoma xenopodis]|uniref:Uncharacterized protein n=1 Tax=Protopolystoma xenopodis TaxID=117903 RepID=A0A3S5ASE2_9PLAT|nr:unnamed protein product [Protopolystoma xenopodis]
MPLTLLHRVIFTDFSSSSPVVLLQSTIRFAHSTTCDPASLPRFSQWRQVDNVVAKVFCPPNLRPLELVTSKLQIKPVSAHFSSFACLTGTSYERIEGGEIVGDRFFCAGK